MGANCLSNKPDPNAMTVLAIPAESRDTCKNDILNWHSKALGIVVIAAPTTAIAEDEAPPTPARRPGRNILRNVSREAPPPRVQIDKVHFDVNYIRQVS